MEALEVSEKLKQAGIAEPQAKAVTSAIQEGVREAEEYADDTVDEAKKELAKQADIVSLKADFARLESRMVEMELRLEKNLAERDARSLRFSAGLVVAMTGIFSIIVKLL